MGAVLSKKKMQAKKVLIVSTSARALNGLETGLWAEELAAPYFQFTAQGYQVTVASTAGGEIPIDQTSVQGDFFTPSAKKFLEDEKCKALLKNSVPLSSVKFQEYDAVFVPGGHGACVDMHENRALIEGLQDLLKSGKVVGSVCHGPFCFVGLKDTSGQPLIKNKKVTGFSDSEERAVGKDGKVPFLLESKLKELGGKYECAADWHPFAVRDGNLISGQNPMSSERTAELMIEALKK